MTFSSVHTESTKIYVIQYLCSQLLDPLGKVYFSGFCNAPTIRIILYYNIFNFQESFYHFLVIFYLFIFTEKVCFIEAAHRNGNLFFSKDFALS